MKQKGKGTDDHLLPLGDWFYFLSHDNIRIAFDIKRFKLMCTFDILNKYRYLLTMRTKSDFFFFLTPTRKKRGKEKKRQRRQKSLILESDIFPP